MDAKILDSSKDEISLSISKSDIGTLYIIQHELLQNNNVDFAGVIVKHPLTNECWMKINTPKTSPSKEISNAIESAFKRSDELKKLFDSKIKVK